MFKEIKILYGPKFATTIVYILQSSEYKTGDYLQWFYRITSFSRVEYRRQLVRTKAARLLLLAIRTGIILNWLSILWLIYFGIVNYNLLYIVAGITLLLAIPLIWGHLILLPFLIGGILIKPSHNRRIANSAEALKEHKATIIAVAGSYGKTSMKEMLYVMLGSEKKVTATSGNQNVPISHSRFAEGLDGDEDILIIEYGEGAPGDIEKFAKNTHPGVAIITGLAPAHLNRYKTLDAAAKDIFSLRKFIPKNDLYINSESEPIKKYLHSDDQTYSESGVLGWSVSNIKNSLTGLEFKMSKGKLVINIKSGLIGKHLVGPIALAAALSHKLGVGIKNIEAASAALKPYEHRMQPYALADAWIIDDTYNGNIEGMRAGLELLSQLPAKRKIYVTPGLVDQGEETKNVHIKLGSLIATANPDKVVLMKHSVTKYIEKGLNENGYQGEVIIEDLPLEFYNNLEHWVAAGDLVLMQNDWTDNYN